MYNGPNMALGERFTDGRHHALLSLDKLQPVSEMEKDSLTTDTASDQPAERGRE